MSAHRTAAQLETITGGLMMAMMISAQRGADAARAGHAQRTEILAHNASVARIRAGRRRVAAATAAQAAVGASRMNRWLDRVAH